MKELKVLYVEDDQANREDLIENLDGLEIEDCKISIQGEESFEKAVRRLIDEKFNLAILDLYKGRPGDDGEKSGLSILNEVKDSIFIPVIFYSGNTDGISTLKSQVVGIATKGEGVDALRDEIRRLILNNTPFINYRIFEFINDKIKEYFWGIIQEKNTIFKPEDNDHSLGYLLLRNICKSLSRDNICKILGDDSIAKDKVHPMEFYIYPKAEGDEYENGDIIEHKESKDVYVILTPSCDFIDGGEKRPRKAERVLLAKAIPLTETKEFVEYQKAKNKGNKNTLLSIISSRKGDRYFFMPGTPFISNRVIDFQVQTMVNYNELDDKFNKIAKLDDPFAQDMTSTFIRYYNRIGSPDLDGDYVFSGLDR